jgi:hypothetical protein
MVIVSFLITAFVGETAPAAATQLFGLTALLIYGLVTWHESRREPMLLNPLVAFVFCSMLRLGLATIYSGQLIRSGELSTFYLMGADLLPWLPAGLEIGSLAALAFYLGYKIRLIFPLNLVRKLVKSRSGPAKRGYRTVALWMLPIVLFLSYSPVHTLMSKLGAIADYAPMILIGMPFILLLNPKAKKADFILAFILASLVVVRQTMYSHRGYALFVIVGAIWALLLKNRRKGVIACVILALVYTVILHPAGTLVREDFHAGQPIQGFFTQARGAWHRSLETGPDWNLLNFPGSEVIRRMQVAQLLAVVKYNCETYGHLHGASIKHAFVGLVPRAFWPEKPRISRSAWMTVHLGWAQSEEEATTSTGITAAGELYWDFGLIGVFIGMILIGQLYRCAWDIFGSGAFGHPISAAFAFMLVMVPLGWLEGEASTVLPGITHMFVFGLPLVMLTSARRRMKQADEVTRPEEQDQKCP